MHIDNIKLENFRNYGRLDLDVGSSVNVFYGNNAQGKTNIIESINMCSCLCSHRTNKEREMIKFGSDEFNIKMLMHDKKDDFKTILEVNYNKNDSKRNIFQDNINIRKVSQYIGICNTVTFFPEDLNIIKGAPVNRRKFVNLLISKISPIYYDLISSYSKLYNRKNVYIKKYNSKIDESVLDFYDFSLAELFSKIVLYRYKYINLLSLKASNYHSIISSNKEVISLSYITFGGVITLINDELYNGFGDDYINKFTNADFEDEIIKNLIQKISKFILEKILSYRSIDIEKNTVTVGLNKDDIDIKLNDVSMRNFSSQGQNRSASLSLKLAELEIIKEQTKTSPILLLDDVFSELDKERRKSIVTGLSDVQIFITCTDKEFIENEISSLDFNGDLCFFKVTGGKIINC